MVENSAPEAMLRTTSWLWSAGQWDILTARGMASKQVDSMRISRHNALSFFAFMDQAKLQLQYIGDDAKSYVERLAEIRGTFTPDDIQETFFAAIEAVVTDLASHFTERDMRPVEKRLRPEAAKAIDHLNDAVNWLRDHQE